MEGSFKKKKEKKLKDKNSLLSSLDSADMDNATKERIMRESLLAIDRKYMINNQNQDTANIFM